MFWECSCGKNGRIFTLQNICHGRVYVEIDFHELHKESKVSNLTEHRAANDHQCKKVLGIQRKMSK